MHKNSYFNIQVRAGEMAQSVKGLAIKPEHVHSVPRAQIFKDENRLVLEKVFSM